MSALMREIGSVQCTGTPGEEGIMDYNVFFDRALGQLHSMISRMILGLD